MAPQPLHRREWAAKTAKKFAIQAKQRLRIEEKLRANEVRRKLRLLMTKEAGSAVDETEIKLRCSWLGAAAGKNEQDWRPI